MLELKEIYWVAALLDGEGSFHVNKNGTCPEVKISMVDLDTIEKYYRITKSNPICTYKLESGKDTYVTRLTQDRAIGWMQTIYSLMSARRQKKIREVLDLWKNYEREYITHCKYGHEYTEENTYIEPKGVRSCRTCRQLRNKEQNNKRRGNRREEQAISMIAMARKISREEAKKIFYEAVNKVH